MYWLLKFFFKDIGDFLPVLPGGRPSSLLPHTYDVEYASDGNDNALEDPVTVTYTIEASSPIPSGAIMVYGNVNVTADDIDSKFICFILQEL